MTSADTALHELFGVVDGRDITPLQMAAVYIAVLGATVKSTQTRTQGSPQPARP